jgi:hypothetical protein
MLQPVNQSHGTCTCDVHPPNHSAAIARSISGYAVYLDLIEDGTVFDPVCPFHGQNGSMVAVLSPLLRKVKDA